MHLLSILQYLDPGEKNEKGQTPQMNRLKASHRIKIVDKNKIY